MSNIRGMYALDLSWVPACAGITKVGGKSSRTNDDCDEGICP